MNFPSTQKTGRRAELAVEDHFFSWDWNVGYDQIDIGYDLFITPSHDLYRGVRFLVQVKGTSKKGSSALSVAIDKARLRQYARDILPVFLIRVSSDGVLYWLHVQAWANGNAASLSGSGKSRVIFDPARTLSDRVAFEGYLDEVIRPLMSRADILASRTDESAFRLNNVDRDIESSVDTDQAPLETRDKAGAPQALPELKMNFSFRPVRGAENLEKALDAYHYGFPRSFDVEDFNLIPADEIAHLIKPLNFINGHVTVGANAVDEGVVYLCSGTEYSVLAQEQGIAVNVFRGAKGVGLTNEMHPGPLDLAIKMDMDGSSGVARFSLGMRLSAVKDQPLQSFTELAPLAAWAEQIAAEDAMSVSALLRGSRSELLPPMHSVEKLIPVFQRIRSLSRLHMIARTLKSEFHIADGDDFTKSDFEDIDLAFDLLRGERKIVNLGPMVISLGEDVEVPTGQLVCTTCWELVISGKTVGDIPIEIDLRGYVVEPIPEQGKVRISRGEHGRAEIRHIKGANTDARVVRSG